ncbi:uncharacterized protein LOC124888734 [Capsicum annuum]|uniref:uncharacterized protein LOC124888734 n=1 Tax=Capsicum annuum TaxID=4072 RepID=UPI001FB124D4|nr:uncharacterized protein LOC124888734 [Capsicum annuum]
MATIGLRGIPSDIGTNTIPAGQGINTTIDQNHPLFLSSSDGCYIQRRHIPLQLCRYADKLIKIVTSPDPHYRQPDVKPLVIASQTPNMEFTQVQGWEKHHMVQQPTPELDEPTL